MHHVYFCKRRVVVGAAGWQPPRYKQHSNEPAFCLPIACVPADSSNHASRYHLEGTEAAEQQTPFKFQFASVCSAHPSHSCQRTQQRCPCLSLKAIHVFVLPLPWAPSLAWGHYNRHLQQCLVRQFLFCDMGTGPLGARNHTCFQLALVSPSPNELLGPLATCLSGIHPFCPGFHGTRVMA